MRVRLREWRQRRLLSQRELAALVGMSQGSIARIERGVHRPRLSTIRRMAHALDVAAEDLVDWDDDDRIGERALPTPPGTDPQGDEVGLGVVPIDEQR